MDYSKQDISRIRREVAYKKMVAEEAGLDRLFLRAYHRSIRRYPAWIRSIKDRKYVHPEVADATEKISGDELGETFVTEFVMGKRKYKVISRRRGTFFTQNIYYIVELFADGEKAFAVSEKHDLRLKDEHYYTLNIEAYRSDDWVEDFKKINDHWEKIAAAEEAAPPEEDIDAINRLKEDFNLGGSGNLLFGRKRFLFLNTFFLLIILLLAAMIALATLGNLF